MRSHARIARACRVIMLTCMITHLIQEQAAAGMIPLNDLGTRSYWDYFQGGLYPNGSNHMPADHAAFGRSEACNVQSLNALGRARANGHYALVSIGMSNTLQEFCSSDSPSECAPWTFTGQAETHPKVNHGQLRIVNGASAGQVASKWDSPSEQNYDLIRDERLLPLGLSEAQVQVVWLKVANAAPTRPLPVPDADAYVLVREMGDIVRSLKVRYPNLQQVFVSSRIYAGYATTTLNPEPYAYESGFAVKWLIEAQINQMAGRGLDPLAGDLDYNTVAPWIAWGPYLWANGVNPRRIGLVWDQIDFEGDGTHPSRSGEEKVGKLLLDFMLESPFSRDRFVRTRAQRRGQDVFAPEPHLLGLYPLGGLLLLIAPRSPRIVQDCSPAEARKSDWNLQIIRNPK